MDDLPQLERALLKEIGRAPERFGFEGAVRATYVQNPGNLANANFTVSDGRVSRHVKLSPGRRELDRWFELRELLAARYRAPEILGRIEVDGMHGLVFPHLPGLVGGDDLLPGLAAMAAEIHADRDLADRLREDPSPSYRSCYFTCIFECLSEDLLSVKADPAVRSLLSPSDLRFAEREVEKLRAMGEERLSDDPVTTAIHGDLWLQNVIATDGCWHLLDWDHVRIGDPASDYATLLLAPAGRGVDPIPFVPEDRELRDRFDLLLRAGCFDEIVDPLSDLTEEPAGLFDRENVWRERRLRSEVAMKRYRETYG